MSGKGQVTDVKLLIQKEDFDVGLEYQRLVTNPACGAVVTFVGKVRDFNQGENVAGLCLEHYPGMTERTLHQIIDEAVNRWPLQHVTVIHRVGELALGDQIVFVGVASAHRGAAFAASEFIMDYLKTRAPFWKKEMTEKGSRWVDARESDQQAVGRWSS